MPYSVDAIPESVLPNFLQHAKEKHIFWYEMFALCSTLGLRNIECRELQVSQIDLERQCIRLTNTKSDRVRLTRKVNQKLSEEWMVKGQRWLKQRIDDPNVSILVRIARTTDDLLLLAEEFDLRGATFTPKPDFIDKRSLTFAQAFRKRANLLA
ncbi:hypothetical protein JCM19233_6975 [Vibrio astriarenae]|nr:hypothetical protein JCM19233_6975 [Vibrio sp. C7]